MKKITYFLIAISFLLNGCKKEQEWLDVKYSLSSVVPTKISDFRALLDNDNVMNALHASIGSISADNYFSETSDWQNASSLERNAYIWAKDILEGGVSNDWTYSYQKVEYANVVVEGLQKIQVIPSNATEYNEVMATALFHRSMAFYNLVQTFAKPYTLQNKDELGIPLRMTADVNVKSTRNTIKEVYEKILSDLKQAETSLPVNVLKTTRPSKYACQALLSRVYLNMNEYDSCIAYSTKALSGFYSLINFNTLSTTATVAFPTFRTAVNPEILFYATSSSPSINKPSSGRGWVDTLLYRTYSDNDLRKQLFYRIVAATQNQIVFRGSYMGGTLPFGGIGINEILLNRSESYARTNKLIEAANDLNTLLRSRFKTNTYTNYIPLTKDDTVDKILLERRKELPFTGILRWEDLRRLNTEPRYQKTLQRTINGQTYTLPPNDSRYVFEIPEAEIRISGIQQNIR